MKQKGFPKISLLFILLLALITVSVLYKFSPLSSAFKVITQNTYKTGVSALYFQFEYPFGWHVYSGVKDQEKETGNITMEFFLNPEPILEKFPHANSYLRATGTKATSEKELEKAIKKFKENWDDAKPLNWQTGDFKGQCFDSNTYNDMDGNRRNITCIIYITPRGNFIYRFELEHYNEYIEEVDPGLKHLEHFIGSLKKVDF